MNEVKIRVIVFIIGLVIGVAAVTSVGLYLGAKSGREAQATIDNLTRTNRGLQTLYIGLADTNRELKESLDNRQRVINKIDGAIGELAAGLEDSGDLIQQIIDTITRIEYLLRN